MRSLLAGQRSVTLPPYGNHQGLRTWYEVNKNNPFLTSHLFLVIFAKLFYQKKFSIKTSYKIIMKKLIVDTRKNTRNDRGGKKMLNYPRQNTLSLVDRPFKAEISNEKYFIRDRGGKSE